MSRMSSLGHVIAAIALIVTAGACGPQGTSEPGATARSGANSPEEAVRSLTTALEAGDCAAAQANVVDAGALDCDMVAAAKGSFADDGIDLDASTFRASTPNGPSASVEADWGNGTKEPFEVELIDGRWKVNFDSAA